MRLGALAALATCGLLWAARSHAAIVDVTYSGLATGHDSLGIFGGPFFFTNAAFTTHYAFDENSTGLVGHALAADITVNGHTVDLFAGGGYQEEADEVTAGWARRDSFSMFGRSSVVPEYTILSTTLLSDLTPGDLTIPYSATGSFDKFSNQGMWDHFRVGEGGAPVDLVLRASSIVVTSTPSVPTGWGTQGPGGVPEPMSWALMILGLGGVGAAARRGRAANLLDRSRLARFRCS